MPLIRSMAGTVAAAALFAASAHAQVSTKPGVGAIPFNLGSGNLGVTFRTWAPNATSVSVGGTFNNWSATAHPLSSEGNGWWSRDVPLIQAGAQYKFAITRGGTTYWKNDARARKLTSSVGNSVVYSPSAYSWQSGTFQMPEWTKLVAYELHVGTFFVPSGTALPGTFATATQRILQRTRVVIRHPHREFQQRRIHASVALEHFGHKPYAARLRRRCHLQHRPKHRTTAYRHAHPATSRHLYALRYRVVKNSTTRVIQNHTHEPAALHFQSKLSRL